VILSHIGHMKLRRRGSLHEEEEEKEILHSAVVIM
jgi:hypothetical protein